MLKQIMTAAVALVSLKTPAQDTVKLTPIERMVLLADEIVQRDPKASKSMQDNEFSVTEQSDSSLTVGNENGQSFIFRLHDVLDKSPGNELIIGVNTLQKNGLFTDNWFYNAKDIRGNNMLKAIQQTAMVTTSRNGYMTGMMTMPSPNNALVNRAILLSAAAVKKQHHLPAAKLENL